MTLDDFLIKSLDVPFVEFGRDWDGWDCWGIPVVAYREILGVTLPDQSNKYTSTQRRTDLETLINEDRPDEWVQVDQPQPLDCAVLKIYGRACHVGLMVTKRDVLHIEQACKTAMVERVDRFPWRGPDYNKVEGFYRHVSQK